MKWISQLISDLKLKRANPKKYEQLIRERRLQRWKKELENRQKYSTDFRKITSVWLDERENECDMCGACEATCPEVFEVPEKMIIKPSADYSRNEFVKAAAEGCPPGVIAIEFENSGKRENPF